jgi:hypothetical protein
VLSRAWDEQKEKENSKGHRTGQLLHIAFMVFITFDLFYTGLSFSAGVTERWDAQRSIDTPLF